MIGLLVWSSLLLAADKGEDVTSLAAYCKQLDPHPFNCTIADDTKIADLAKPAAPYLAARIFWTGDSETTPNNDCYLGIKTDHSWTVAPIGSDCWGNGKYFRRLAIEELAVRGGDLWLQFTTSAEDPDIEGTVVEEFLVVCGIAEGTPRCTAPIALGNRTWRVKASLSKKGALVLALAKGKRSVLPAETAALLGTSTLSFDH